MKRAETHIDKQKGNMSSHSASKKEAQQLRRASTSKSNKSNKSNKKKKLSETNSDQPASALNRKQTESTNNRRISLNIRG